MVDNYSCEMDSVNEAMFQDDPETLIADIPDELKAVILRYREGPEEAVYTEAELMWLLSVRNIGVMWMAEDVCLVEGYDRVYPRNDRYTIKSLRTNSCKRGRVSNDGSLYQKDLHCDKLPKAHLFFNVADSCLTERKRRDKTIIALSSGRVIKAVFCFLDLRSVFLLLKRRHTNRNATDDCIVSLSVQGTLRYLDSVIEECHYYSPMTEMFLSMNVGFLQLSEYVPTEWTANERCDRYMLVLKSAIKGMC